MRDDDTIGALEIDVADLSAGAKIKMCSRDVEVYYGEKRALNGIDLDIHSNLSLIHI